LDGGIGFGEEKAQGKKGEGKIVKMKMPEPSKRECQAGRWLPKPGAQMTGLNWGNLFSSLLVVKAFQANLA
jgi:hypothetical protein